MKRTDEERRKEAEEAYDCCKAVDKMEISYLEAVEKMVKSEAKVNEGSAKDYLNNFSKILKGKCYKRAMNYITTEHFLEGIRKDYPIEYLKNAVKAVEEWIEYYENTKKKPRVVDIAILLKRYIKIIDDENE